LLKIIDHAHFTCIFCARWFLFAWIIGFENIIYLLLQCCKYQTIGLTQYTEHPKNQQAWSPSIFFNWVWIKALWSCQGTKHYYTGYSSCSKFRKIYGRKYFTYPLYNKELLNKNCLYNTSKTVEYTGIR
jgi:hypothetical protein